jgi:hypothetical protein
MVFAVGFVSVWHGINHPWTQIIHQGTLTYANETTICFEDGQVYTRLISPIFSENNTAQVSIHYDFSWWTPERPLIKGQEYRILAVTVCLFWSIPLFNGVPKVEHV